MEAERAMPYRGRVQGGAMSTRIAIVGAGNVGGNLGMRFSSSGFPVRFGVRAGSDVSALLAECAKGTTSSTPEEACAWGEVVYLAVPGKVALDVARSLPLDGKIVVDCNNPLTWNDGPVWAPP